MTEPSRETAGIAGPAAAPRGFRRRQLLQLAAAGAALTGGPGLAVAAVPSEMAAAATQQPAPDFGDDPNTADIIVETLLQWGVTHVFGVVGDGINSPIEALRKRQDKIAFIPARHEEAAAFMACEDIRPAIRAALASPKAALVEAVVDPEEKPTKPDELKV